MESLTNSRMTAAALLTLLKYEYFVLNTPGQITSVSSNRLLPTCVWDIAYPVFEKRGS